MKQERPAMLFSMSNVVAQRVRVTRALNDGVQVMAPAEVSFADLDVTDTEHNGVQVLCTDDGDATQSCAGPVSFLRAELRRSSGAAVLTGAVAPVMFEDLMIANEDVAGRPLGLGLEARRLGAVTLRRFDLHGANTAFRVTAAAELELEHGFVHDNGHAIEAEGDVDLHELLDEIEYRRNTTLYVPL